MIKWNIMFQCDLKNIFNTKKNKHVYEMILALLKQASQSRNNIIFRAASSITSYQTCHSNKGNTHCTWCLAILTRYRDRLVSRCGEWDQFLACFICMNTISCSFICTYQYSNRFFLFGVCKWVILIMLLGT